MTRAELQAAAEELFALGRTSRFGMDAELIAERERLIERIVEAVPPDDQHGVRVTVLAGLRAARRVSGA